MTNNFRIGKEFEHYEISRILVSRAVVPRDVSWYPKNRDVPRKSRQMATVM